MPVSDLWGVLMRRDSPLSDRSFIRPEDLWDKPLILSRQNLKKSALSDWLKVDGSKLNIVATYNLIYNASLMVDEGMGYAITLDKLINTTGDSSLCFKPLSPKLEIDLSIVWKKYAIFSKASEKFLLRLQKHFGNRYPLS